jgi:hypothetical protein
MDSYCGSEEQLWVDYAMLTELGSAYSAGTISADSQALNEAASLSETMAIPEERSMMALNSLLQR